MSVCVGMCVHLSVCLGGVNAETRILCVYVCVYWHVYSSMCMCACVSMCLGGVNVETKSLEGSVAGAAVTVFVYLCACVCMCVCICLCLGGVNVETKSLEGSVAGATGAGLNDSSMSHRFDRKEVERDLEFLGASV